MVALFNIEMSTLAGSITSIIPKEHWDSRWDILIYVDACKAKGFAETTDQMQACAKRYMAGKRKVNPPGTARKKKAALEMRRLLANIPPQLNEAVNAACATPMAEQYRNGNTKAINALVGMVMKAYKTDPATVRSLLETRLST